MTARDPAPLSQDEVRSLRARAEADHAQHSARGALHRELNAAHRLAEKARKGRGCAREEWGALVGSGDLGRLLARAEGVDDATFVSCLPALMRIERDPIDIAAIDQIICRIEQYARSTRCKQGRRRAFEFFLALHLSYEFVRRSGQRPSVSTVERWLDGADDVVCVFDVDSPFVRFSRASAGDGIGERALRDAVRDGRHTCWVLLEFGAVPPPYRSMSWIGNDRTRDAA